MLHNVLLGIGTILVYVAANVLLLENQPERNLPLAYCVSAVAMLAVGRLYAYGEHRWPLRRLAARALLASLVLTLVLSVVFLAGAPVAAAVAIMVGYRLIYLLTSLEFWGMSAVVFNVRQSRRLFSIISAGDMPAKALGALLAVFVHLHYDLYFLLLSAFGLYVLALSVQRSAFGAKALEARPLPPGRAGHPPQGHRLVLLMGLSLTAIAVVGAGVEYLFFVNVKQKLQTQGSMLYYVGSVLALTYMLATVFKLLVARHGLDRLGLRWALAVLPLAALAGIGLYGVLSTAGVGPMGQMAYFCGLYLGLEVLRRAVFEPVFLVLFQPLPRAGRLRGHTWVKSFYEPLGLGLAGLLLLGLYSYPDAGFPGWAPLGWVAIFLLAVLVLLQGAYRQYLVELKNTLGLRFTVASAEQASQPAAPAAAEPVLPAAEVLTALRHLHRIDAPLLQRYARTLLRHPKGPVRRQILALVGEHSEPALLRYLILHDPDAGVRELASHLASRHPGTTDLLLHPDMAVRKGAIQSRLEAAPADAEARASLAGLVAMDCYQATALALVRFLPTEQQVRLIITGLCHPEETTVQAATRAAAAVAPEVLTDHVVGLLHHKAARKAAAECLVKVGEPILPFLQQVLARETDGRLLRELSQVCRRIGTPASRQVLVGMAQDSNLHGRAAALRALSSLPRVAADAPLFQRLVEEEMRLAQYMLHSMTSATAELRTTLRYELRQCQQRLLGLLMQLYEQAPLLTAQRGLAHAGERQANALEILDNLIPRPLYLGLQALLDVGRLSEKVQTFESLLGPAVAAEPIQTAIVRRGTAAFSAWTVGVALRQWHPAPNTVGYLYPHLQTSDLLVQQSAEAVLCRLPVQRPASYDQLLFLYPTLAMHPALTDPGSDSAVSFLERVRMLKSTALFAQTPENVLGTIVPIMHEVVYGQDEEIFAKGTLGTSLFIIYEGEVGIFTKGQLLTSFSKGEFFGELALLDAEPRSASAVALRPVQAFRIDQDDFYDVTEECTEVVRTIMRELCHRLRHQNEKMVQSQPDNESVVHSG
ncbi:cyclic nucleotide-binding domain-containing protein [Hymenobacter psychrotolerans]|uniref:cyclic nucleotide-binding domain-containing protein n=1 Tax=Hymenobacter psychrotolerans TaxID=344998 RepID=UPI001114848B|nr:cyclic nucleotide-binding domain-containing protein [Hymenobacter psychrotolerans]